jgi:hypothetical protein
MNSFVYGTLWDEPSAADTLKALEDVHVDARDISLLIWENQGLREIPIEMKTGASLGAVVGALVGIVVGVITASYGPFEVGSLLGAVGIAYGGGAAGLVLGGLAGLGYWNDEPGFPPEHSEDSDVVVGVMAWGRAELAEDILHQMGARDIHTQTKRGAIEELEHQMSAA